MVNERHITSEGAIAAKGLLKFCADTGRLLDISMKEIAEIFSLAFLPGSKAVNDTKTQFYRTLFDIANEHIKYDDAGNEAGQYHQAFEQFREHLSLLAIRQHLIRHQADKTYQPKSIINAAISLRCGIKHNEELVHVLMGMIRETTQERRHNGFTAKLKPTKQRQQYTTVLITKPR